MLLKAKGLKAVYYSVLRDPIDLFTLGKLYYSTLKSSLAVHMYSKVEIKILGPSAYSLDLKSLEKYLVRTKMFSGRVSIDHIEKMPSDKIELLDRDLTPLQQIISPEGLTVFLVRCPIQGNFFVRSLGFNYSTDCWFDGAGPRNCIVLSSYEMSDIAKEFKIDLAHLIAITIWKFGIVNKFLRNGGKYFSLYLPGKVESSIFNFCEKKLEIVDCYKHLKISERAIDVLRHSLFTEGEIKFIQSDIERLRFSRFRRFLENIKESPLELALYTNVITSAVFFLIGILVSVR